MNISAPVINHARASRIVSRAIAGGLVLAATAGARDADAGLLGLVHPEQPAPALEPTGARTCTSFTYAVALAPGQPADQEIAAELCVPSEGARDTVLLTVHGATYSSLYWDFPYQPERYSFVRHANAAGYATLNFDRLGNGESDRPFSLQVAPTAQAYIHHQLVEALRSGELGHAWSSVVLVGHSLGSMISILQAATYHDVDGVVVTGFMHNYGPGLAVLLANLHPAALDPRFASSGLDAGYLTTQPGARGPAFYHLPNADPAVVALDEQTKGLGTSGELAQFAAIDTPLTSLQVDAPVLSIIGRHDTIFCGLAPCGDLLSATTLEPAAYAPAAELEIAVVPNAGHDLNLQQNAPAAYAAIRSWLDDRFPPLGN